eukprot:TRINITY_DN116620_c0_g1_i1.p3 TRINITY_DN116620_c0_g1~~TRINITY_DN116620_c0_g1_i1.p3  ORF type:complete len:124 (+),score=0.84 TRINITY_DN116620_c0_g1_i1:111-482(+)
MNGRPTQWHLQYILIVPEVKPHCKVRPKVPNLGQIYVSDSLKMFIQMHMAVDGWTFPASISRWIMLQRWHEHVYVTPTKKEFSVRDGSKLGDGRQYRQFGARERYMRCSPLHCNGPFLSLQTV